MAGLPDVCAPVVVEDTVVPEWGPASWEDSQWDALEAALENNAINVKKINSKATFFGILLYTYRLTRQNVV